MSLGFGISTQNRKKLFFETLEAVYKYAPTNSLIVINDDASTDGTKEDIRTWMCDMAKDGPRVVLIGTDKIVGVANSKSNLVHQLLVEPSVTDIFLIEDDVLPMVDGWWQFFLDTAWEHKQAHLLYLPTKYKYGKTLMLQDGPNPIEWKQYCSGLVMYFREELLRPLKGFENRFGRYGWEHNELTSRCLVAQMMNPVHYPHCASAETNHALISRDIESERFHKTLESSTTDDSPDGKRTKQILARQNAALYKELMDLYHRAFLNVQNHSETEKLAHRTRYYFKKPKYSLPSQGPTV